MPIRGIPSLISPVRSRGPKKDLTEADLLLDDPHVSPKNKPMSQKRKLLSKGNWLIVRGLDSHRSHKHYCFLGFLKAKYTFKNHGENKLRICRWYVCLLYVILFPIYRPPGKLWVMFSVMSICSQEWGGVLMRPLLVMSIGQSQVT